MFNNPLFMNMVSQLVSDPQVQRVMSNLVNNMFNPNAGASGALEVENPNANILGMPPMGNGFDNLFQSAQSLASQMNPEFLQQMRERMNINPNPSSSTDNQKR